MLYKLPIVIFVLILIGCSSAPSDDYTKLEAFDDIVQSFEKYSASGASRNINWSDLSDIYRPQISEDLSKSDYFGVIRRFLLNVKDPHVWLISPDEAMYSIDHLGYTENFDDALLVSNYLTDLKSHTEAIKSGFINNEIGYLVCKDFKGDVAINDDFYKLALERFDDTKGLIIDLRFNDGGSVYNAQNLLNKLSTERLLWHTTQNKTIDGFDDPYEWYIEPDQNVQYNGDVVVLTGRYTISAGERFIMGAQLMDNITIVGDTTANTQGSVMGREMLNGWQYTLTFETCLSPDGVNYAGVGVPPDHYMASESSIVGERDFVIERALEILE